MIFVHVEKYIMLGPVEYAFEQLGTIKIGRIYKIQIWMIGEVTK